MDWSLVGVVLLVIQSFLMVYCFIRLVSIMQLQFHSLDSVIAQAIQKVLQEGGADFEPVNPVQAALAQFISTRLGQGQGGVSEIIARAPDGKFTE